MSYSYSYDGSNAFLQDDMGYYNDLSSFNDIACSNDMSFGNDTNFNNSLAWSNDMSFPPNISSHNGLPLPNTMPLNYMPMDYQFNASVGTGFNFGFTQEELNTFNYPAAESLHFQTGLRAAAVPYNAPLPYTGAGSYAAVPYGAPSTYIGAGIYDFLMGDQASMDYVPSFPTLVEIEEKGLKPQPIPCVPSTQVGRKRKAMEPLSSNAVNASSKRPFQSASHEPPEGEWVFHYHDDSHGASVHDKPIPRMQAHTSEEVPSTSTPKCRGRPASTRAQRAASRAANRAAKSQRKTKRPQPKELPRPFSVLIKEQSAIAVFDIQAWVARDSARRVAEVKFSSGSKIPRPCNSYILYRKAYQAFAMEWVRKEGFRSNENVSQAVGMSWAMESDNVKEQFKLYYEMEHEAHAKAFPEYSYKPKQAPKKVKEVKRVKKVKKVVVVSDSDSDDDADCEDDSDY